jgi:hypothetical protein
MDIGVDLAQEYRWGETYVKRDGAAGQSYNSSIKPMSDWIGV